MYGLLAMGDDMIHNKIKSYCKIVVGMCCMILLCIDTSNLY